MCGENSFSCLMWRGGSEVVCAEALTEDCREAAGWAEPGKELNLMLA